MNYRPDLVALDSINGSIEHSVDEVGIGMATYAPAHHHPFVGSIIAETVGSNNGVGHLIIAASSRFDIPPMFAGLIVTSAMGVAMYALATLIERRALAWSRD